LGKFPRSFVNRFLCGFNAASPLRLTGFTPSRVKKF